MKKKTAGFLSVNPAVAEDEGKADTSLQEMEFRLDSPRRITRTENGISLIRKISLLSAAVRFLIHHDLQFFYRTAVQTLQRLFASVQTAAQLPIGAALDAL